MEEKKVLTVGDLLAFNRDAEVMLRCIDGSCRPLVVYGWNHSSGDVSEGVDSRVEATSVLLCCDECGSDVVNKEIFFPYRNDKI